jgi:hypothetical protein
VVNNSSLLTADRATHLKIVVLSLVCATLVASIGIASRLGERAQGRFDPTVISAAKPVTAATTVDRTIR